MRAVSFVVSWSVLTADAALDRPKAHWFVVYLVATGCS
jgi:hypothetical protein